ncbi:MAG: aminotransferase class-III [Thermomicrobiales bacterium]|jgi:glutamate-1-semialdehyde 2,1-aminomutase|nr:aminotransferase class-III [Thermomicrobiales bacterium]
MKHLEDLHAAYMAKFPTSRVWAETSSRLLPGGVAHDGRATTPFPLFITSAAGPRKHDLDGNDLIDYWMGHGALMLGHSPPAIVDAVVTQSRLGTHYGASHLAEVRWAQRIIELVPSAERVRFVASGTEATLMALRLSRAATGRSRICRFEGHFHGWHDWVVLGNRHPFYRPSSGGVPPSVEAEITVLPNNDVAAAERALSSGDVAAVILEPGGGTQGRVPIAPEFLGALRDLTTEHGTLLIFDEVVTGFRIAPGGVQERTGITPDLTALAKIVAGGLPGGAVCGRRGVMDVLAFTPPAGTTRVAHPGTFNANPLSAVAGVAMLEAVADGSALDLAATSADRLRTGLNTLLAEADLAGWAYGDHSIVHVILGETGARLRRADGDAMHVSPRDLLEVDPNVAPAWRTACLYHGLDLMGPTMMVSSTHDQSVISESLERFSAVFATLSTMGTLTPLQSAA